MQLDIQFQHPGWLSVKTESEWEEFFNAMIPFVINEEDTEEISLVLASDEAMHLLNATYRHKDKPTNVLSFPSLEPKICLGDIVLSLETIQNEATDQGKTFDHHVAHLFVHGILHLMGHDHIEDDERTKMEAKEIQILERLDVPNPYDS